ncbi:MAG TPA: hypothetical protein VMA34_11335 [Terracidiphilus sp.]|nr:hypothetical protein [Terracidiphilus sp.]
MKADRPLIGAVLLLATGLSLVFIYGTGTSGFNIAFPFSGSTLHLDLTTSGLAVLGGVACTALGALLLVWAFLVAIVCQIGMLLGRDRYADDRYFGRHSSEPDDSDRNSERNPLSITGEQRHTLF